jgi:hypothetical protein
MKKAVFILLLTTVLFKVNAQNNQLNLVLSFGPGYFLNNNDLNRHINNTKAIGINYCMNGKKKNFIFSPTLNLQINSYRTPMSERRLAHVNQYMQNLNLDVLLKVSKQNYFFVGLLFNKVSHSVIEISQTHLTSRDYYIYSNNKIDTGYSPTMLQAGFNLGFSHPFELSRQNFRFDIKFSQIVSQIVNHDYTIGKDLVGVDSKILNVKVRPSILIFSIAMRLHKRKPKVDSEEEE